MSILTEDQIINQVNKITKKNSKKTRSQIAKLSSRKGKIGERNIVDFLKDVTKLSWVRVFSSGAFTGGSNRDRAKYLAEDQLSASISDIFPPDQLLFKFLIESKFYKNFSFNKITKKKEFNKNLEKWTKELLYDCITYITFSKSGKTIVPILWIKINNEGEWALINRGYYNKLFNTQLKFNECCPYYLEHSFENIDELKHIGFDDKWIFCKAREFISNNKDLLFKQIEI